MSDVQTCAITRCRRGRRGWRGSGVGWSWLPQSGPLRRGLEGGDGVPIRCHTERSAGQGRGPGWAA